MTSLNAVAIYARYSTDRQDARSCDDQVRRCRGFATDHGLEVVAEFRDAAQSGATLERADMQRMLAATRQKGGAPFRAILVDDLSRLSRDLGNTWRIVFEDLAAVRVKVIDCNTGISSDGAAARLTFGAMALVNDTFLQLVKAETHRGLEGRALAGFHTGGRCYGFETIEEPNPEDREHPRALIRVNEEEAKIVLRVFEDYVAGISLGAIASRLNEDGIRAPYDTLDYEKPAGRGWATNQIHSMLRNERYIGIVIWNKRQYYRDPVSKKRRSRIRPESEWVKGEGPRIVFQDLWERVQARHRTRNTGGRPRDASTRPHLLTGILRCGTCGAAMSITSVRVKHGVGYPSYGCSAHKAKGNAICPNRSTISERLADRTVLAALVEYVESDDFRAWIEEAKRAEEAGDRERSPEVAALEAEVRAQAAKVDKVGRMAIESEDSEFLTAALRAEEINLRALRTKLAAATKAGARKPSTKVNVAEILTIMRDIARVAASDPTKAREVLAVTVEPIALRPAPGGGYEAEIALRNDSAAIAGGRVREKSSCGGRI
jgi:site-specific DNA recombinase